MHKPLADHLQDYRSHLEAKGNVLQHNLGTIANVNSMLTGCGFVFATDVNAARVAEWLNALRRGTAQTPIPDKAHFTPSEAAALLGISLAAVRASIKRLNLSASGHGKARLYPRATVEALALNRSKGCSPATINHYIIAARGFFRWLVRSKRIGSNPIETLSLVNTSADIRRARRELSADQLRSLLTATRTSAKVYRGLTGEDRFHLYLLAAGTGIRASALSNLAPADFDLNTNSPVVTLAARFAKNRKAKIQPLPADVAEAMRDYLAGKPLNSPIWAGTWARQRKAADMLRIDLEASGIDYVTEGPDGPEYADFHSLRHTFLTLGGRSGIDLRTLQELAGHSKPELTARYSHRRLYDLAGAIEKLPNLVPTEKPTQVSEILRATGTDGAHSGQLCAAPDAAADAATRDIRLHSAAPMCTTGAVNGNLGRTSERPEKQAAGADLHRPASTFLQGDRRDLNPRLPDPQSEYVAMQAKPKPTLTIFGENGCSTGCSKRESEGGHADADLEALVAMWSTLPDAIKAAIRALVAASKR